VDRSDEVLSRVAPIAEHSIVEAGLGLSDFAAVDGLEWKGLVVRRLPRATVGRRY
jgi:hypothetical protein